MTYEEFINSLVDGVQFYDDFRDNGLGVLVPTGWTKLGSGQTPTIVADSAAFGGKALRFANVVPGSAPTALGFDDVGSPTGFEILMRVRTDAEYTKQCTGAFNPLNRAYFGSSPCEPDGPPYFGGPGGLLSYSGGILRGLGARGSNRSARCDADMYWGFGPCALNYRPAGGAVQNQDWSLIGADSLGVFSSIFSGTAPAMLSGDHKVRVTSPIVCDWGTSRAIDCPEEGQFGNPPGNIVKYSYMRYRLGGSIEQPYRQRIKWWPCDQSEPLSWLTIESDVPAGQAPPSAGPCGILHVPHANMSSLFAPYTYVDFVSVSLNPTVYPAATPPDTPVAGCPLPNGQVGVAFAGTFDPNGLYQNT